MGGGSPDRVTDYRPAEGKHGRRSAYVARQTALITAVLGAGLSGRRKRRDSDDRTAPVSHVPRPATSSGQRLVLGGDLLFTSPEQHRRTAAPAQHGNRAGTKTNDRRWPRQSSVPGIRHDTLARPGVRLIGADRPVTALEGTGPDRKEARHRLRTEDPESCPAAGPRMHGRFTPPVGSTAAISAQHIPDYSHKAAKVSQPTCSLASRVTHSSRIN